MAKGAENSGRFRYTAAEDSHLRERRRVQKSVVKCNLTVLTKIKYIVEKDALTDLTAIILHDHASRRTDIKS